MLAHHPITGKEIRVIQTDASLWKEHKTLVFGSSSVYESVDVSGSPTFLIMLKDYSDIVAASKRVKLLFIRKSGLRVDEFRRLNIQNVIALEEIHNLYPHLGQEWDGTIEDAAVLVAGLLRYRRITGIWNERADKLGLVQGTSPKRLWWVTQYYNPSQGTRRKEIRTCLERNSKSALIDRIVLLNEKKEEFPKGPIEERVIGHRLTYADVIHAAATFPPDVIVAFANADICIDDESWRELWQVNLEGKFLGLLRYDVPDSGRVEDAKLFGPRADSQDTWVIQVSDILTKGAALVAKDLDFQFGRMGCDNALALEMMRKKFVVSNPALSLKTWHFHSSGVRNYEKHDVLERPVFHYITPSGFHDLNPAILFEKTDVMGVFTPSQLSRPIMGPGATTWLSAANKKTETALTLNNNTIVPSKEFILSLRNCFQTPGGLVFDRNRLMIGESKRSQVIWSKATMSAMTPSIECKRGLIAPWPVGADKSREIYMLKYLSKILQLEPGGAAAVARGSWEFFCPEKKEIVDALEAFDWRSSRLPVIKHEEDIVVWCEEARAFAVSDNECILSEDIAALRKSVRGWKDTRGELARLIIVQDGTILDDNEVRQIEQAVDSVFDVKVVYPGRTSPFRMVDVFAGAWGVVCGGNLESCGWNWLMPVGSFCFQVDLKGDQDAMGLSAAAGLEHRFCSVKKVSEEILKLDEDPSLPIVWMPRAGLEGYFSHPGDSFREMARLWDAAGYCRVKEHPTATMVWWGEVGVKGVLLYDRPNHDWRLAAPVVEKEWRKALFGNPKPTQGQPWFFWPRRPEIVERLSMTTKPYESRSGLVFYGKVENKVQEKRRNQKWADACTEWIMVKGTDPYPFTHTEYLEKLQGARFGLCLAGYGYKCHREIECMAMGCVPVCAPEVDMDSYAVPPVEGTHYIRVETPEQAMEVANMSQETWETMSAACRSWWKENCSCEGSFALTKQLIEN